MAGDKFRNDDSVAAVWKWARAPATESSRASAEENYVDEDEHQSVKQKDEEVKPLRGLPCSGAKCVWWHMAPR